MNFLTTFKNSIIVGALFQFSFAFAETNTATEQQANTATEQQVSQALRDSSGLSGLLQSAGLKNTKIVSTEINVNAYSGGSDGMGLDTDGPAIVLESQISNRVRAQVKLAFQELVAVEAGHFVKPFNWSSFIEEAKIIIDQDPQSKIPFVTIIGKQELENGSQDSEMTIEENGPLHGITRISGAYAVQFQMDEKFIKGLDSVAFSLFTTGHGNEDNQGDNVHAGAKGALVAISKNLSDRWILSGSLTHITYPGKNETRLNWGVVYKVDQGGYKVFFNHALFNYNPLYPDSKSVWTFGVVKKMGDKNSVTAEMSHVSGVKSQWGLGYRRQFTDHSSAGIGIRYDRCSSGQCKSGTTVETQYRYSLEKEDNEVKEEKE